MNRLCYPLWGVVGAVYFSLKNKTYNIVTMLFHASRRLRLIAVVEDLFNFPCYSILDIRSSIAL